MTNNWNVSADAENLHQTALVWDNHVCLPHVIDEKWMHDLKRHKDSGANIIMLNIGDSDIDLNWQLHMTAFFRRWIKEHSDEYQLVLTTDDLLTAKRENKLGIGFDIEGAHAIDDINLVQLFYDLGVRWMLMAYNRNNHVAGGCHDDDTGLTEFGYQLIEEMDRVGMVKCCTHTGYHSVMQIMDHTDLPVIFSHSNPRALKDHPRNIPDELIIACAKTKGVVCLSGVGLFLGDNDIRPERIAEHIDYVAQLVGIDHAGIGTDAVYDIESLGALLNDGAPGIWPEGYGYSGDVKISPPENLPRITEALLKLGYSDDEVRKVLGENLLRVARQVWK